jgi:hypothetical protein
MSKLYVGFLCNSLDARTVGARPPRFSSNHKFNLFGGPTVRHGPMSRGAADCGHVAKLPELLRKS